MKKSQLNNIIIWGFVFIILILTFIVLKPIFIAILFGSLLGYIFKPAEKKLRKLVKKKTISTLIILIILLALIIIPIVSFTPTLVKQTFEVYGEMQDFDLKTVFSYFPDLLLDDEIIYQLDVSLNGFVDQAIQLVMQYFSDIIINIPGILLQIFVAFFTFFFVVKDFDKLNKYVSKISPFSKGIGKKIANEFKSVTNAVLMGQVLVGLIQGLLMGLGFFLLGFDNLLTLTFISMIFAIIPIIGPWLVWGPIAIYSLIQGDVTTAIILFLYGAIFVSNIDNLIRPYFVSKSSNLPIAISLIGTVGGLMAFGIIGLIIGPLILAYTLIVLEVYRDGKIIKLENTKN